MQALVAEHKLGAQGRKLGIAMQKELINTPERLAMMKTQAAQSWAAIKRKRDKKDHCAWNKADRCTWGKAGRSQPVSAHAATHSHKSETEVVESEDLQPEDFTAEMGGSDSEVDEGVFDNMRRGSMTSTMRSTVRSTLRSSLKSAVKFNNKTELVNDDEVSACRTAQCSNNMKRSSMTSTMKSTVRSTLRSSLKSAVKFNNKTELVNDDEVRFNDLLVVVNQCFDNMRRSSMTSTMGSTTCST